MDGSSRSRNSRSIGGDLGRVHLLACSSCRSRYLPTTLLLLYYYVLLGPVNIKSSPFLKFTYFTLLLYPHQQQHHPASLSTSYLPNYLNFQYPFFTPFFLFFRVSIQLQPDSLHLSTTTLFLVANVRIRWYISFQPLLSALPSIQPDALSLPHLELWPAWGTSSS